MPTYTKLFNSIVTSTIWTEDDKTRIVWITMLAMADQHGEVHASIPGLARVAGVSLPDCEMALGKLLSPDEYSRTPDNEGRRIAPIPGGWELLNHAKYRIMASKEDSKNATAERVRRHRARNAPVTLCNAAVTVKADIAEAEAEAEVEPRELPKKLFRENKGNSTTSDLSPLVSAVWSAYPKVGRERSNKADTEEAFRKIPAKDRPTPDDITAAVAKWKLSLSWTDDGGAFVPGVHRWVKARQWQNIPDPACTTKPSRHAGLNTMEITGNEF
jgi:hypothetical protein